MFKKLVLAVLCLLFLGCGSEPRSEPNSLDTMGEDANAMWEREKAKLPAGETVYGTDTSESKMIIDSTAVIYDKAGGADLVESDLHEKKCNRYMLTYQLRRTVKGTSELKEITKHLGHTWHLKNTRSEQTGCRYQPMTSLFLYDKKAKEFMGEWVAMIAFNPDHPNGDVSLSWTVKWK